MPSKRILLVDYDPRSLTHTREVLEGAGFDVSTCGDGLSALDQFKSLLPDIVLLSAMLPKMHGFEVCSNIRKLPGGDRTPVVIITDVYKGKRYRVDAINKYGATEYIEKPIEDSNLVNILTGLVRDNGKPLNISLEDGEKTVQFNREVLNRLVREEVTGAVKTSGEKKVSEKPKSKDDISKKLEQSLAGLDLEIGKKPKAKPKQDLPAEQPPAATQAAEALTLQTNEQVGSIFTSEDLFTDVIASVERELQSEKGTDSSHEAATVAIDFSEKEPAPSAQANERAVTAASGTSETAEPTVILPTPALPVDSPKTEIIKPDEMAKAREAAAAPKAPEAPKAAESPKPAAAAPRPEATKKSSFDSDLEKKLSSTLSGLKKESAAKPAAKAADLSRSPELKIAGAPKTEPMKAKAEPARPVPVAKVEAAPATKIEPKPAPIPAKPKPVAKETGKEEAEGINFGQYLLLAKIATGGMAELFKAKRKGVEGFEKILAIKRILPHMSDNEEFVTMFIDEAKLAAQLTHHNICQIFDLGKIENSYYIAMEYVHGKDLRAVLKASRSKNNALTVDLAVLITSKICSALDYAHRKRGPNGQPLNLVHRDVSPQNILISYEGDVKLVDFGIAKAATKVHVTQHGALKGKLLYMSPEQAWGKPVDRRADIFSLGTVLYELLTGRPLFFDENDTEVTILEKVREAKVMPIREFNSRVPQELEKIVSKALKKSAEDRYQTAYEMQKDLDSLFYAESYSATSGNLARYVRDLFPGDWSQEADEKELVTIEKDPEPAVAAPVPVPGRKLPEQPAAPAKAVKESPAVEKKPEPVAAAPLVEAPAVPKKEPAAFRDISSPEIMAPPEKSSFPIIPVGLGVAIVVFILAYFLFSKSKEDQPTTTVQQQETAPAPSPVTEQATPPPPAPIQEQATTATPVPEPVKEPSKEELTAKAKEEEAKKLAEQKKAEEEKRKEEERKKQQLAKLEEEQKQAQEEALKAQQAQQAPPPAPTPQEDTTVAEQQPPAAQPPPVQESKPQPAVTEEPKQQVAPPPAKPAVNEGDLVELTSDVTKPEVLSRQQPSYPRAALTKKVEGTVIVSALISESGKVLQAKVLRGAGGTTGLNEAAVASVKSWTFRPAVKAGKRVKVWVTYPIVFKLAK